MSSLKKNYFYSVIYQLLALIVPIVTIPYVSRVFGAEKLGVFSYTNTVAQYFTLFAMLGLNNYGVRTVAMVRDNQYKLSKTFTEIFAMQSFVAMIVLFLYLLFLFFMAGNYKLLYFILLLQVASSLVDVNWFFFGTEQFGITVLRNSIVKLLTLIFIFLLIKTQDDIWIYTLIHSVSILISAVVLWPSVFHDISFIKPKFKKVISHVKPNLILFVPIIAISVYKYIDKIMLGLYSVKEVGYFDNVEKILTVALGFVTALGSVMLPRISNVIANNNEEQAKSYLIRSMDFIMFLSIGIASGMCLMSTTFVPLYFGQGFLPCIGLMRVLGISAVFSAWANVIRTQFLIPYKKDKIYVWSVILGAILNFVGNLILIPHIGAMGAAISTVVAELSVALTQSMSIKSQLPLWIMLKNSFLYILLGLSMVFVIGLVNYGQSLWLDASLKFFLGGLYYTALSTLFNWKKWNLSNYIIKLKRY